MKRLFTLGLIALLSMLATALPAAVAHADAEGCDKRPANSVNLVENDATGTAVLCTLSHSLKGRIALQGLTPGNAYTVWWVYFDTPGMCVGTTPLPAPLGAGASDCDLADFEGVKPLAVFGRMASGIAPRNGRLVLKGRVGGMQPSTGSEVWMLVFGHGPAAMEGSALARQLLTPEDPLAGAPHLGNSVDGPRGYPVASAVFKDD